jgi:ligand-binding sensor domain-containing protein
MKLKLSFLLLSLLAVLYAQSQNFTNYTVSSCGIPSDYVTGVAVDSQNNKWFSTQEGVAKFDGSNWTVFTTADGLITNYSNCITVDSSDNIWVGSDEGVSRYDGTAWSTYTTASGLVNDMINYIGPAPNGDIWVGTSNGLSRFSGGTWTSYTTSNGLPFNMVSYVKSDENNNLWIGTWMGGLAKYNDTSFTTFTTANGLLDNNIIAIGIDKVGNKWIGTYFGISVLDLQDNLSINYTDSTSGIYNNYIQDFVFDSANRGYIGIYADYLMDGALTQYINGTFTNYSVNQGLVSPIVKRLAIDKNNHIWVATGSGVSEFYNASNGIGDEANAMPCKVFPNPVNDILNIISPEFPAQVRIMDATGRVLIETTLNQKELQLDMKNLAPGLYSVLINRDNKQSAVRFIKK